MKYYIIAGEASGDLHASNLMKELSILDSNAQYRVWGGDLMKAQGGEVVRHYNELAFMGFVEVLLNLRAILRNIRFCKGDIHHFNPDVIILIDYPGFNLRIAEYAHQKGYKVFYYISPQIWAWKQSRVKIIKKVVDRMFVILPFEKKFYKEHGVDVDFVGHPLLDAIDHSAVPDDFRKSNSLSDKPIIAILPGSRKQEIAKMLHVMLALIPDFPEFEFVIAGVKSVPAETYDMPGSGNRKIVFNQTYDLLSVSKAAIVTSGTATLETALHEVPEVVCYKGSYISYQLAKRFVKINFISLVNLIMAKEVVKELIQGEMNKVNLKKELKELLYSTQRREQLSRDYKLLKEKLGGSGASAKTASLIYERLI